jgi:peptide/nickel transport system substrate-binding protein
VIGTTPNPPKNHNIKDRLAPHGARTRRPRMTSTHLSSQSRLSKRLVTVGVASVLAVSLAACGGGHKKSAAGTQNASTGIGKDGLYDPSKLVGKTKAGTKKVDKVRWGLRTGEPATLDPIKAGNDSDYIVSGNLCESLYTVDEKFGVKPNLATEAKWTNPTTLDLTLRDGVKFWDGTPMTAKDVVASLERTANPKTGSIYASAYALVKQFKAVDDKHVRITFKVHDADILNALATSPGRVVSAAYVKKTGRDLGTPKGGIMCTGPYSLGKWTAGQSISIKANKNYWDGAPKVGEIDFIPTQDDAALTSALSSGDLDGAFDIPESSTSQLATSGKGTVTIGPSNSTIGFGGAGGANDPEKATMIRQAIALAVDRKSAVKNLLKGYGAPASTFTVPYQFEGLEQADIFKKAYDELPKAEVNLTKAKQLVKKAGATGKTLKVVVPSGNQLLLNIATVVKDAAKKIGLNLKIEQRQPAEYAALFYDPSKRAGVDFLAAVGYQDGPGVNTYAMLRALPPKDGGIFNWVGYDDPKVTSLIQGARTASNSKDAANMFVEAQKRFSKAQLQVTFGVQYTRTFMRKGLSGATTSIAYVSTPWAKELGGTK